MQMTRLGRTGLHVSSICLGTMTFGNETDEAGSHEQLDTFLEAGGTFVDTANGYQDETSEAFIGEWMEVRGVRDQMVIATKVRCPPSRGVFAVEFGSGSDT